MNAAQIKAVVAPMVDKIEWSDLRRGKMHIRMGADVYLIDVSGIKQREHIERMVKDAPTYALNLRYVKDSAYFAA